MESTGQPRKPEGGIAREASTENDGSVHNNEAKDNNQSMQDDETNPPIRVEENDSPAWLKSILARIEQLEKPTVQRLAGKKTTPRPLDSTSPTTDVSLYVKMRKNQEGKYVKEDGTRFTDGKLCKRPDPPFVFTTYELRAKDTTDTIVFEREKTMLQIRSKPLIALMRSHMIEMIDHEIAAIWKKEPVTIQTTNVILAHCFEGLRALTKDPPEVEDEEVIEDLRELLENLEAIESDTVRARSRAETEQAVTYGKVWSLFPPGSLIVGWPFQGVENPHVFVVHRHLPREDCFVITCWGFDWDGANLVRFYYEFKIAKYQDSKFITELECYPLTFYNDSAELKEELIRRGKRFRELCKMSQPMALYKSKSFFTTSEVSESVSKEMAWLLARDVNNAPLEIPASKDNDHDIIIDPALCRRYATNSYQRLGGMKSVPVKVCECTLCNRKGLRKLFERSFKTEETMSEQFDDLYMLLPQRLHGYLLGRKQWGQVLIDAVYPMMDDNPEAAWNALALAEKDRENIKAMVSAYFIREGTSAQDILNIQDPIPGKGEGVVILLHGVPGVGKTMTAETLARSLRRRLLRIDASDFEHSNPGQVSNVFKRYFHMASSWGALLLLDEADVFLQERKRAELAQNALVSVLLRELEYFQGVLIMTTNRIVSIDYAVQSRIHYAVKFLPLKEDAITSIWKNFRAQLTDQNCDKCEQEEIDRWFKYSKTQLMNSGFTGRDLRNVFMCAQLLGYPKVTMDNLTKAVESTTIFRKDMHDNNQKIANQSAKSDD